MEEREEYVSKLQLKLEEKYQDALMVEKKKWLKEQETDIKQQVENEVVLAKAYWDKEQKEVWVKISFWTPYLKKCSINYRRQFFFFLNSPTIFNCQGPS